METSNFEKWRDLVYNLVYPGILGSMLFDIADPLRDYHPARWGLYFIVLLFVTDYWHLKHHLSNVIVHAGLIILDFAIVIGFAFSYFALTKVTAKDINPTDVLNYSLLSQCGLIGTFTFILAHDLLGQPKFRKADLLKVIPILVWAAGIAIICLATSEVIPVVNLTCGFAFILYLVFVVSYSPIKSRDTISSITEQGATDEAPGGA
jgi:hypothetical protein